MGKAAGKSRGEARQWPKQGFTASDKGSAMKTTIVGMAIWAIASAAVCMGAQSDKAKPQGSAGGDVAPSLTPPPLELFPVLHNGKLVHENVDVTGPTRAAAYDDEKPTGPIMLQGDHGPVVFRSVRVRPMPPGSQPAPGKD
jgi:hypothetical protein